MNVGRLAGRILFSMSALAILRKARILKAGWRISFSCSEPVSREEIPAWKRGSASNLGGALGGPLAAYALVTALHTSRNIPFGFKVSQCIDISLISDGEDRVNVSSSCRATSPAFVHFA
jgi:hypothetical protein